MILVKGLGQPIYFLSKNPQIRLQYRRFGYVSNAKVVKVSKLNDKIDIIIEDDYITKDLSSNLAKNDDNKYNNLKQTLIANNKYKKPSLLLFMALISNINDFDNSKIKKLYNLYIENKYTKR